MNMNFYPLEARLEDVTGEATLEEFRWGGYAGGTAGEIMLKYQRRRSTDQRGMICEGVRKGWGLKEKLAKAGVRR